MVRFVNLAVAGAVLAYCVPGAAEILVYDRAGIAGGEWWRLVTGHWVHFSLDHLALDAGGLWIVGWIADRRGETRLAPLLLTGAAAIGAGLLFLEPGLARFGGLSALVVAAVALLAVDGLRDSGPWRHVCVLALALVTLKLAVELSFSSAVFLHLGTVRVVPLSHLLGALWGAAFALLSRGTAHPAPEESGVSLRASS